MGYKHSPATAKLGSFMNKMDETHKSPVKQLSDKEAIKKYGPGIINSAKCITPGSCPPDKAPKVKTKKDKTKNKNKYRTIKTEYSTGVQDQPGLTTEKKSITAAGEGTSTHTIDKSIRDASGREIKLKPEVTTKKIRVEGSEGPTTTTSSGGGTKLHHNVAETTVSRKYNKKKTSKAKSKAYAELKGATTINPSGEVVRMAPSEKFKIAREEAAKKTDPGTKYSVKRTSYAREGDTRSDLEKRTKYSPDQLVYKKYRKPQEGKSVQLKTKSYTTDSELGSRSTTASKGNRLVTEKRMDRISDRLANKTSRISKRASTKSRRFKTNPDYKVQMDE